MDKHVGSTAETDDAVTGGQRKLRCPWCESSDLMRSYHDLEWGTPLHDERKHFEFLLLETMQAGLSWETVLRKREHFRLAFDDFDPEKIAGYDEAKIAQLLQNPGIIRNRRKIEAAVSNAAAFLEIVRERGSFDAYIWHETGGQPIDHRIERQESIPVTAELSDRISADLKRRGFRFVGSTTIYAHLQAIGVVNDHLVSCFRYRELTDSDAC